MPYYQQYTVEDLAFDPRFRQWVNHPTPEQDRLWEQWMHEFPDKRPLVAQARLLVLSLQPQETLEIDEVSIQQEIDKILFLTEAPPTVKKSSKTIRLRPFIYFTTRIAASVALIVSIGLWYWQYTPSAAPPARQTPASSTQPGPAQVEYVNRGTKPMLINLPDKSTVLLKKNSRIYHAAVFNNVTREVHLEGEAFFEVAKDRRRPFYVYTDEVVTRVVGTSFHIRANPADNNISVIVKTGRVAVFTNPDRQVLTETDSTELVLTPNEQLVYQKDDKQIIQSVIKPIEVSRLAIPENNFVFHQTPVSQVFSRLEETYNVDIQYADSQLQNCDLTATFTDEPFVVKLDLICGAIGVSYQMQGSQIIIRGSGCVQ